MFIPAIKHHSCRMPFVNGLFTQEWADKWTVWQLLLWFQQNACCSSVVLISETFLLCALSCSRLQPRALKVTFSKVPVAVEMMVFSRWCHLPSRGQEIRVWWNFLMLTVMTCTAQTVSLLRNGRPKHLTDIRTIISTSQSARNSLVANMHIVDYS